MLDISYGSFDCDDDRKNYSESDITVVVRVTLQRIDRGGSNSVHSGMQVNQKLTQQPPTTPTLYLKSAVTQPAPDPSNSLSSRDRFLECQTL